MWKLSFTVIGFLLLGADKFVTEIEPELISLGVSEAYVGIARDFVGQSYDVLAAIGLAILGINLPERKKEEKEVVA